MLCIWLCKKQLIIISIPFTFHVLGVCVQRIKGFGDPAPQKRAPPLIHQCIEKIHKDTFMERIFTALLNCGQILSGKEKRTCCFLRTRELLAQCSVFKPQIHELPINHLDK